MTQIGEPKREYDIEPREFPVEKPEPLEEPEQEPEEAPIEAPEKAPAVGRTLRTSHAGGRAGSSTLPPNSRPGRAHYGSHSIQWS